MITLITATPGSGKTLWAVREIFNRVNEDEPWNIFSNIDGLKLDTAQPLKEKFEDYPPRSLVVFDEAQKITHFSKKYKHPVKNEMHPEVEFLQTHRHAEFLDIIYITQAPRLLNADVLDMVGTHYHLHRPMGMKMATWWLWKYHQLNPNTKSSKNDAEDSGTFSYPKNLFGMYKSSQGGDDSHGKIRIPMKIINAIWMLVLIIGVTAYLWFKSKPEETQQTKTTNNSEDTIKENIPLSVSSSNSNLDTECRKGINVEKPECVEWFNNLTISRSSVDETGVRTVSYDPSKPYEQHQIQKLVEYNVTAKPVFSGCMKKNGRYIAYTQQGTKLDVSQSDCKNLVENGDRPFNYFKEENLNASISDKDSFQENNKYSHQLPDKSFQAQNQVEPHLQRQINGSNDQNFTF